MECALSPKMLFSDAPVLTEKNLKVICCNSVEVGCSLTQTALPVNADQASVMIRGWKEVWPTWKQSL